MKTRISISKKFDLNKVSFNLSKEINNAANAIVKDHDRRLQFGQGVDGKPMKKLTPFTIMDKRSKKYKKPRVPLYATGTMKNIRIEKKAVITSQEARLTPPLSRLEIGAKHQSGQFNLPKREWFGITTKVEKDLLRSMEIKIERNLRRA